MGEKATAMPTVSLTACRVSSRRRGTQDCTALSSLCGLARSRTQSSSSLPLKISFAVFTVTPRPTWVKPSQTSVVPRSLHSLSLLVTCRYLLRCGLSPGRHHGISGVQEPRQGHRRTLRWCGRLQGIVGRLRHSCAHDRYPYWSPVVHLRYREGGVRPQVWWWQVSM